MTKNPLILLLAGCLLCGDVFAQTTQPASSILQQISVESEKLFQSVRPSLVVVQMPPPRWLTLMMEQNDPLRRWDDKIDPALQKRLMELRRGTANLTPGTAPATQPAMDLQPPPAQRFLGLVVNSEGYVVIPIYVEREAVAGQSVEVFVAGKTVKAKYIGSDRKTNLSVLKLDEFSGKVADLGDKPGEGALVMALSATGESGQLVVWTGGMEENTVVLNVDGKVAGFSRAGQFLSGESSKVIIDQLIKFGAVKRATLGVWLQQFASADGTTGVRIVKVQEDSAAAKGGLQAGDVIVSLNDQPMTDVPTFAAAIAAGKGATPIKVVRNGTQVQCTVELSPE